MIYSSIFPTHVSLHAACRLRWTRCMLRSSAPFFLLHLAPSAALRAPVGPWMQAGPLGGPPRPVGAAAAGMAADPAETLLVQGGSLRTWSYRHPSIEQVQVTLQTDGRPLDADVELWHGPDNVPVKMRVYVEDGRVRPFCAVLETPRGPNTVAVRNIGQMEFPLAARVHAQHVEMPSAGCYEAAATIQGGALRTYPFDPLVDSVQVLLSTDGRPLNARLELLQGPNNNKQVVELYTEDGCDRPFFCILTTPGVGNVVRVVNTAPVEFPLSAGVVAHALRRDAARADDVVVGGDVGWRAPL